MANQKSNTVLLVGGSGFIGSHIARLLIDRGDAVINCDLRPPSGALGWFMEPYASRVAFEPGGMDNLAGLIALMKKHKPNMVVNLAAVISLEDMARHPRMVLEISQGAANVLEAARLMDIQRLVYFSSIGILPSVQYQPIDANHPTLMAGEGPGSGGYGISKLIGEGLCWAYRGAYGLDFVALRPSAAYGFHTGNPTIYLNQMIEGALLGEKRFWDHGGAMPRDYTHVHDIANITIAALNAPAEKLKHRVFYAASGQPLVTASKCAEIVREMVPGADVHIEDGFNEMDKLGLRFRGVLDMKPVEEQLGYKIKYSDIRVGIAEYMDRFCDYMKVLGKKPAKRAS